MEAIELLDLFRNKTWCYYTEDRAEQYLIKLKQYITEEEHRKLEVAFSHIIIWEWPEELYAICKEIRKSFKSK